MDVIDAEKILIKKRKTFISIKYDQVLKKKKGWKTKNLEKNCLVMIIIKKKFLKGLGEKYIWSCKRRVAKIMRWRLFALVFRPLKTQLN